MRNSIYSMSTTTISPHVVESISKDVKKKIANNEDRIQHEIEKQLISNGGVESIVKNLSLPQELGSLDPDDFEDSQEFRTKLNKAVDNLKNNMYQKSDSRTVIEALEHMGIEVGDRNSQPSIQSRHDLNRFVKDNRGEHIMVAPGDELLFLGSVGAGIAFILFIAVVYAVEAFIGAGAAGTLVVVAAGSLLTAITGLVVSKVYKILKFIYEHIL